MPCWLDWTIHDDKGLNPLGVPGDFEFRIEFDFDPGNIGKAGTDSITLADSAKKIFLVRAPTEAQHKSIALKQWFLSVLDKNPEIRDHITTFAAEQMSFCGG